MSSFFDRFKPGAGDKKKNRTSSSYPFVGWFQGVDAFGSTFSGHGQSLGGSAPGQVIAVTLSNPGPLGFKIETSTQQGTAIVNMVVPESQADGAGLEIGDIMCFAGSAGLEEISYDMFLELAASAQRPLCFEVRRVPKPNNKKRKYRYNDNNSSAGLAAAEKREQAHKKYFKPVKKELLPKILSTADRLKLEQE